MQENDELLVYFEEQFQEIHDGKSPRPSLFGYSRVARQVHKVEVAVTQLIRRDNPKYALPTEPETAYERWKQARDDAELGDLFGDIFQSNPNLFNN
jgi:hypothetical protein